MRVDLHCHTFHSGDNLNEPRELIRAARELGLDAIAVTEHDSYAASEAAARIAREENFTLFRGVEVSTDLGHLLLFGLDHDPPGLWRRGAYASGLLVLEWAERHGVAAVMAHPYSRRDRYAPCDNLLHIPGLAAVETANGRCSPEENQQAARAAQLLKKPGIGGSDSHRILELGRCFTIFQSEIRSVEDLVRELRAGRCEAGAL